MSDKEERQQRLGAYMQIAVGGLSLLGVWEFAPMLLGGGSVGGLEWTLPISGTVDRIPWFGVAGVSSLLPFIWESTKWIPKRVDMPQINEGSWVVNIGKTYRGKWVKYNFGGVTPHCIVAGSTKFGKTAFIRTCLYTLCHQQSPKRLRIVIVDLKGGASFAHWVHVPHVVTVERDLDGARRVLADAEAEMWMRLDEIRDARLRFRKVPNLPRLFIVIDEGSLLKLDDECLRHVQNIAAIGREPHVHIIYGSQRPSNDVLPVTIRDSMEGRFVFNLNEPGSSRVVLGEHSTDAYNFSSRPGRMIHRSADGQVELQAAYVDDAIIDEWIQSCVSHPTSRIVSPVYEEDYTDKEETEGGMSSTLSMPDSVDFWRGDSD